MRATLCALLIGLAITGAIAKNGSNDPAPSGGTSGAVDGEQAYKTNCTRCHTAPPALSQRMANTVMRHMRVKANLPARDAQAIYQYLLQSDEKN